MTLAITGATGQLGRLVIQQLRTAHPGLALVALARNPAKAADLGVPVREADYGRPETLNLALAGVDTLLLISGSEVGQRVPQHRAVIQAAKAAGVRRIVYTSLLHADHTPLSLGPEHAETEAMIKASGLTWTLLRNGWYTENYTGSVAGAVAAGALIGAAAGEGRIASAARTDYAAAAVAVLTQPGHDGRTYELVGDQAWTKADLAAELSRQSGKAVAYQRLALADYAAALQGLGLPAPLAQALAAWDLAAGEGALDDASTSLSTLIGRPTTPLAASVKAALG